MRAFVITALLAVAGCDCGTSTLSKVPACTTGAVAGVVCAPDAMTVVADATVTVTGTCDNRSFNVTGTTDATGHFALPAVPEGSWSLTANTGSFTQTFNVDVVAGATTQANQDQQFCFKPTVTNLAVVSGSGDQIEKLLTQVGFTPRLSTAAPAGSTGPRGLQFLKIPEQLKKYSVIFFDCAAGRTSVSSDGGSSKEFNFGADAQTIADQPAGLRAERWIDLRFRLGVHLRADCLRQGVCLADGFGARTSPSPSTRTT